MLHSEAEICLLDLRTCLAQTYLAPQFVLKTQVGVQPSFSIVKQDYVSHVNQSESKQNSVRKTKHGLRESSAQSLDLFPATSGASPYVYRGVFSVTKSFDNIWCAKGISRGFRKPSLSCARLPSCHLDTQEPIIVSAYQSMLQIHTCWYFETYLISCNPHSSFSSRAENLEVQPRTSFLPNCATNLQAPDAFV